MFHRWIEAQATQGNHKMWDGRMTDSWREVSVKTGARDEGTMRGAPVTDG